MQKNPEYIEELFKVTKYTIPSVSYTANTEKNDTFDLTSYNTSGYKAVGVLGFNVGQSKATIRRCFINNNALNISVTTNVTTTADFDVYVLEQLK